MYQGIVNHMHDTYDTLVNFWSCLPHTALSNDISFCDFVFFAFLRYFNYTGLSRKLLLCYFSQWCREGLQLYRKIRDVGHIDSGPFAAHPGPWIRDAAAMTTPSHGNVIRCAGNPLVTSGFPSQRVQITACGLIDAKPLSESMLVDSELDP